MELIKQVEINIDYILSLIKKYQENNSKDKEILLDINKAIDSSMELRNKKDLINKFISSINLSESKEPIDIDKAWLDFVESEKIVELEEIIKEENLNKEETYKYIRNSFRDGHVSLTGTEIASVLPKGLSRFSPRGERKQKRETVLTKLTSFFNKFFDISSSKFNH